MLFECRPWPTQGCAPCSRPACFSLYTCAPYSYTTPRSLWTLLITMTMTMTILTNQQILSVYNFGYMGIEQVYRGSYNICAVLALEFCDSFEIDFHMFWYLSRGFQSATVRILFSLILKILVLFLKSLYECICSITKLKHTTTYIFSCFFFLNIHHHR